LAILLALALACCLWRRLIFLVLKASSACCLASMACWARCRRALLAAGRLPVVGMLLSLLLLAAPSVGCRPEAVVAGDEVVRDGEEVFGELALRIGSFAAVTLAENHELDASLRKEPLHKLEGKAAQAVAVGNHNCCDRAAMDELQKPLEAGPVPVEAGPDVSDAEVGVGALLLEVGGLALKVAALVVGRDAGVADDVFARCCRQRWSRD